jgi:hypothetical protein
MPINHKLAVAKLYAAARELGARGDENTGVLRPSMSGRCPYQLWQLHRDPTLDNERPARMSWMTLQGTFNEHLMIALMTQAGAEVVSPPDGSDETSDIAESFRDPVTGFLPHFDGLVRWPSVGVNDWSVLEFKYLRALGHLQLAMEGLYSDRDYWYQACSYVHLAPLAINYYAAIEADRDWEPRQQTPWNDLFRAGVEPRSILFVSVAKDPSSANMLFNGQVKSTIKERGESDKPMTPEEERRAAIKQIKRDKREELGGELDFYMEYVEADNVRDAEAIAETIGDIQSLKAMLEADEPPEPIYTPMVAEDEMEMACKFCPDSVKELCIDWHTKQGIQGAISERTGS